MRKWSTAAIAVHVVLYGVFFICCTHIYYLGAMGVMQSDLPTHFGRVANMELGSYSFNRYLLLPGYMLGEMLGTSAFLAIYTTLTVALTEYIIRKLVPSCGIIGACLLAFTANFVTAIFIPPLHSYIYLGNITGNIWHNSTYLTSRLFAVLSIVFYLRITGRIPGAGKTTAAKVADYVLFGASVLVATGIKPSVYAILAPTVFVMCVIDLVRQGPSTVKRSLLMGVCLIIPLAIIATQYEVLFHESESAGGIALGFAVVWRHDHNNIIISFLQSFAFPLAVLIGCFGQMRKDRNLQFAWIALFFGLVEYLFVYETGPRMYHGNFSWGFQLAAFYLMLASLVSFMNEHPAFFRRLRLLVPDLSLAEEDGSIMPVKEKVYVYTVAFLYMLHLLSGLALFCLMLLGHNYTWHWRFFD